MFMLLIAKSLIQLTEQLLAPVLIILVYFGMLALKYYHVVWYVKWWRRVQATKSVLSLGLIMG